MQNTAKNSQSSTNDDARRRIHVLRDERGIVMLVALGLSMALAGLTLAVSTSGQMSSLTAALASQATAAFYVADGAAYHSLGDNQNFVPFMNPRNTDLTSPAALDAAVTSTFSGCRVLPGNLLVRTKDGNVRAAQFGQIDGIAQMFFFTVDARKKAAAAGVDPTNRVSMQAAKPGTSTSCDGTTG
jgi:hypothetical protein